MGWTRGLNQKSTEARQRKRDAQNTHEEQKQQLAENNRWEEKDKKIVAKLKKKIDIEEKQRDTLLHKAELKALAIADEECLVQKNKSYAKTPPKPTSAQVANKLLNATLQETSPNGLAIRQDLQGVMGGNVNRLRETKQREAESHGIELIDATGLEETMRVLKIGPADPANKKKLRALWNAFEEINLPRIRAENASLRMSQHKELCWKEWQKSPENPINKR